VQADDGGAPTYRGDLEEVADPLDASVAAGVLVMPDDVIPVALLPPCIGSTPMVGMLTQVAPERHVTVLHADQSEKDHAQRGEMSSLVGGLKNGALYTFYRDADQWLNVAGHIPSDASVYLCGGNEFLQNVRGQLENLEDQPREIRFELFSPNDWLIS